MRAQSVAREDLIVNIAAQQRGICPTCNWREVGGLPSQLGTASETAGAFSIGIGNWEYATFKR